MSPAAVQRYVAVGITLQRHALDETSCFIELGRIDAKECRSATARGIENVAAAFANRARRAQVCDGACQILIIGRRAMFVLHRSATKFRIRQTRSRPLTVASASPSNTE